MFQLFRTIKRMYRRTIKSRIMRGYILLLGTAILLFAVILIPIRIENIYLRIQDLKENRQYIREETEPLTHLILLDNSASMENSFYNMDKQLIDCMLIQHSILQEKDHMIICPLFPDEKGIVDINGTDDFEKSQSAIRGISLFEQEEKKGDGTIEAWLSTIGNYVNQEDMSDIRITIITDKSTDELGVDYYIDTAKYYTRIVTSGENINGNSETEAHVLSLLNADAFMETLFNTDFYVNYHGFDIDQSKSQFREYHFPETIYQFTMITEGEDHYISHIFGSLDDKSEQIKGTILSDSCCMYQYNSEKGVDYLSILATEDCRIMVLYPTNDGKTMSVDTSDNTFGIGPMLALMFVPILIYIVYRIWAHRKNKKKKIFISYRREGAAVLAKAIADQLRQHNYDVFLDTDSLKGEKFDEKLLWQIEESDCVVTVIPPRGLDRCLKNENDWVRKEIAHAIYKNIPLIPVTMKGFTWPAELPVNIAALQQYNAVNFDEEFYYHEGMEKVLEYVTYAVGGEDSLKEMLQSVQNEEEDENEEEKIVLLYEKGEYEELIRSAETNSTTDRDEDVDEPEVVEIGKKRRRFFERLFEMAEEDDWEE